VVHTPKEVAVLVQDAIAMAEAARQTTAMTVNAGFFRSVRPA
jgi:hypothetical protein